jgi:hypothetical protein
MQNFFGILYVVFFLGCVLASLFILFHLLRYALDKKLALFMSLLFTVVTITLLISNTVLFFNLSLDSLITL